MTVNFLPLVLSAGAGYLIGSLSFSILLSRSQYKDDIRNYGSGNAGMTNMLRTFGKWAAVVVFAGDFLKGLAAVLLGGAIGGEAGALLAGFFAVVGHAFPLYFHFRGGKGVATSAGVILGLHPLVLLVLGSVFLLVLFLSRIVSLSSICAAVSYPITALLLRLPRPELLLSVVLAALVIWLHRANIGRLMRGEEHRFGVKKKD